MIVGFPFMLLTLSAPFPLIWIWLFVTCFCLFFNTGPTNTILANVSHPSIRAAGFALNILVIHAFGDVLSPVVIGVVSDRWSMHAAFVVVGADVRDRRRPVASGARGSSSATRRSPRRARARRSVTAAAAADTGSCGRSRASCSALFYAADRGRRRGERASRRAARSSPPITTTRSWTR